MFTTTCFQTPKQQQHEFRDWVSFTLERFHILSLTCSGGELLLASCSQDCLIRVWKLCAKSGTDAHTEDDHAVIRMKEDVFEVKDGGERATWVGLGKKDGGAFKPRAPVVHAGYYPD